MSLIMAGISIFGGGFMLRRRIKRRKQLEEVSNFTSVRFTKEGQPTLTPLHSSELQGVIRR